MANGLRSQKARYEWSDYPSVRLSPTATNHSKVTAAVKKSKLWPIRQRTSTPPQIYVRKTVSINGDILKGRDVPREYETWSSLGNHPYILACEDFQCLANKHILDVATFWSEYCAGGDLSQYIRKGGSRKRTLAPYQATQVVYQITSALMFIHHSLYVTVDKCGRVQKMKMSNHKRLIHRDIKPQDIFISYLDYSHLSNGEIHVKLGDFGCAKQFDDNTSMSYAGTVYYQAPESRSTSKSGDFQHPSATYKMDIWSFGVTVRDITDDMSDFHGQCCQDDATKRPTSVQLMEFLQQRMKRDENTSLLVLEALRKDAGQTSWEYLLIERILETGADPNALGLSEMTAIQFVAETTNKSAQDMKKISELLIKHGASPSIEPETPMDNRTRIMSSNDTQDLAVWSNPITNHLGGRYERTGRVEELDAAIRVARQSFQKARHSVGVTSDNQPDLAGRLNTPGENISSRYERTGTMDDLEEMIQVSHRAPRATPDNYSEMLKTLGERLSFRREGTREIDDLEEMIRVARQAIEIAPDNHPHLAGMLNNLGEILSFRYERTRAMDDLKEIIRVVRRAIKITPKGHPDRVEMLSNLGEKLSFRYKRTRAMDDLVEMIRVVRRAVKYTPKDHPDLAGMLNNLWEHLGSRYERTETIDDLEEMTRVARQIIKLPSDHPHLARRLNNLGNLYKSLRMFDEAEDMFRRALIRYQKALVPDHMSMFDSFNNLSNLYVDQGKMAEAEAMFNLGLQGCEEALGPKLLWILDTAKNLGILYADPGKVANAEVICTGLLQCYEERLGRKHVRTLDIANNLGILYGQQGKLADAEAMFTRVLQGYEQSLGPKHTWRSNFNTFYGLSNLCIEEDKLADARDMYYRMLFTYKFRLPKLKLRRNLHTVGSSIQT